jgi:MoxR-like ATPase
METKMSDYSRKLAKNEQLARESISDVIDSVAGLMKVREQITSVIVGQEEVIDLTLNALLCEGHVLLEGVPGLGKTLLVRTLADSLALKFSRIQFTPDLLPADVIGTSIAVQDERGSFSLKFEPGPVFGNLILADEINRASPKTQSALLEAMQEQAVTVRGTRYALPRPFQVLATQNPLEMEGTYALPEAQVDRFFFKILVKHPSETELESIIERTSGVAAPQAKVVLEVEELQSLQKAVREVLVPPHVTNYAARLVLATRPDMETSFPQIRQYVRYGAGPRGAQALILAGKARALTSGRFNVGLDDIKQLAGPALRHRIALNFNGYSEGIQVDDLLQDLIARIPTDVGRQF